MIVYTRLSVSLGWWLAVVAAVLLALSLGLCALCRCYKNKFGVPHQRGHKAIDLEVKSPPVYVNLGFIDD